MPPSFWLDSSLVPREDASTQEPRKGTAKAGRAGRRDQLQQSAPVDRPEFVGHITPSFIHELLTPISSIEGAGSLLEHSRSPEEREEFAAIIRKECRRLGLLVDLLDSTQLRPSEYRDVDVSFLLDEVVKLSTADANGQLYRLTKDCPNDLPPLYCNRDLIQRVLLILTANAMQLRPPDGEIVVFARSMVDQLCVGVEDRRFDAGGEHAGRESDSAYPDRVRLGLTIVREIMESARWDASGEAKFSLWRHHFPDFASESTTRCMTARELTTGRTARLRRLCAGLSGSAF